MPRAHRSDYRVIHELHRLRARNPGCFPRSVHRTLGAPRPSVFAAVRSLGPRPQPVRTWGRSEGARKRPKEPIDPLFRGRRCKHLRLGPIVSGPSSSPPMQAPASSWPVRSWPLRARPTVWAGSPGWLRGYPRTWSPNRSFVERCPRSVHETGHGRPRDDDRRGSGSALERPDRPAGRRDKTSLVEHHVRRIRRGVRTGPPDRS